MYSIGNASPILLIILLVRSSALSVHTKKSVDESTLKNASNFEDTFSFTGEVLRAWTPKKSSMHGKPKLPPSGSGTLNNSALAPTPAHEQKRRLRSGVDAKNATNAAQASLVQPPSTLSDMISAYQSAYDTSAPAGSIEVTGSQSVEAHASDTGMPPPPFHSDHKGNESTRVLGPMLKNVEQKQGFVAVCFAMAALILASCCFFAWYVGSNRAGDEKEKELITGTPQPKPKTHANLLTAMKCADGTWAQNYEAADEQRKAALELLFRCNIVRVQEFAHSRVNQEHIDECVWIATHMLRKKALQEWVEHWEEARQTFEDGVTACFQARTATKDAQSNAPSPDSPSSPFRMGDYGRQLSSEMALNARDSTGENILAQRCREIMSQSRQRHTPRDSRSGFRTVEPPDTTGTPRSRPVTPRSDRSPRSAPTSQADLRAAIGQPVLPSASPPVQASRENLPIVKQPTRAVYQAPVRQASDNRARSPATKLQTQAGSPPMKPKK